MRRAQSGFTLIEVVVAFVLLSLVLATGFEIFTGGLRRAIDLEDRARALMVARSVLASAGAEQALAEAQTRGQTQDGRHRWTLTVAKSQEGLDPAQATPNLLHHLYRIDATVQWRGADEREHTLVLATLKLGSR